MSSTTNASKDSVFSRMFGVAQKLGKSLMLPVSVLPVAGILLGVGGALVNGAVASRPAARPGAAITVAVEAIAAELRAEGGHRGVAVVAVLGVGDVADRPVAAGHRPGRVA